MNRQKYYDIYDEKILALAAALVATLILFILTFFIGCGTEGTRAGVIGAITYSPQPDTMGAMENSYSKTFEDDTTNTEIQIKWAAACGPNGCLNKNAAVFMVKNKKNCVVHALLPNDQVNHGTEKKTNGMTDIIITYEQPAWLNRSLHIRRYHIYGDGTAMQL